MSPLGRNNFHDDGKQTQRRQPRLYKHKPLPALMMTMIMMIVITSDYRRAVRKFWKIHSKIKPY